MIMDDLDVIKGFRNGVPPVDPAVVATARAAVVREARGGRGRPARRRLPALRWGLAATGGLAVMVAVVTAVGPRHGPPAVPEAQPAPVDGAQVLLLAAGAARDEPALAARPDQFVYIESVVSDGYHQYARAGVTYVPGTPVVRRAWLSVDGSRDSLVRYPSEQRDLPIPGCRRADGGKPCVPRPAFRTDLPATADGMFRWIYADHDGGNPRDVEAFMKIADLIGETYLPPATMAALFEAASRIPGVTVDREARDASGRRGIGVASPGDPRQLVFDPQTYEYLGQRGLGSANEITGAARIRLAIVDKVGQLP